MTLLPIVERELRVASRRRWTYWSRVLVGLGLFLFSVYLVSEIDDQSSMGKALFITVSIILFGYALCSGVWTSADSLSREKREGTLGLLFLTDLRSLDIILGKLAASSLQTFYGLLAALPMLALSMVLGGVAFGAFARVCLAIVVVMMLSLCVGMLFSSTCRRDQSAQGWTILFLLLMAGATPVLALWLDHNYLELGIGAWVMAVSPGRMLYLAHTVGVAGMREFWLSLSVSIGVGLGALTAAAWLLPRIWWWQEGRGVPGGGRSGGGRGTGGSFRHERLAAYRRRLLEANPLLWVNHQRPWKVFLPWIALAALAALWVAAYWKWGEDVLAFPLCYYASAGLHLMLKLWIASEAAQRFAEDRANRVLELHLCTPLSVGQLIRGQWLSLRRLFLGPMIAVTLIDLLLLRVANYDFGMEQMIPPFLAGMVFLWLDAFAMASVAMWAGFRSGKPTHGSGSATAWVLVFPLVLMFLFGIGGSLNASESVFALWVMIGIGVDVVCYGWSMGKLRDSFRSMAAEPVGWKARKA